MTIMEDNLKENETFSKNKRMNSDIQCRIRSISHGSDINWCENGNDQYLSNSDDISIVTHRKGHVRSASSDSRFADFSEAASRVAERAEEIVINIINRGWDVVHAQHLPGWLKDNDYLLWGHRPQLNSFRDCFNSIFRIHTETVNIWTHLVAFIAFIFLAAYFLSKPIIEMPINEKIVFSAFFVGAILCLGFSWTFHTFHCHSEKVGKLFHKLDYCGITFLTVGSNIVWLHYSFYCKTFPQITYMFMISVLGAICICISLMEFFATPQYRSLRAFMFVLLGLSSVIPCGHYIILEGFYHAVSNAALGWLVLMATLYISGACIYALRIPERFYPGRFDIWFQSHQIFHVFVVAAAVVHLIGMLKIAQYRKLNKHCISSPSMLQ